MTPIEYEQMTPYEKEILVLMRRLIAAIEKLSD